MRRAERDHRPADWPRATGRLIASRGTCMVMGTASTMACFAEILGLIAARRRVDAGRRMPSAVRHRRGERQARGRDGARPAAPAARAGHQAPRSATPWSCWRRWAARPTPSSIWPPWPAASASRSSLDEFDEIGRTTPVLIDLKPSGRTTWSTSIPPAACRALMRQLGDKIDTERHHGGGRQYRRSC